MPFGLPISPQVKRYLGVSHSGTILSQNGLQIPAPNSDYNVPRRLIRDFESASLKFSKSKMKCTWAELRECHVIAYRSQKWESASDNCAIYSHDNADNFVGLSQLYFALCQAVDKTAASTSNDRYALSYATCVFC
jgi:hypothetical protein